MVMNLSVPISPLYRRAVFTALIVQFFAGLLSAMALDMGVMMKACGLALVPFWTGASILIFRRPQSPTKADIALVRFGFIPVFILMWAIGCWVLTKRGIVP